MRRVSRRLAIGAALCALGALSAVLPASASAAIPPLLGYTVTVAPGTINAGTTAPVPMTVTVTDTGLLSKVESAALVPPAAITVVSATVPTGAQPVITMCGTPAVQCVELPDLDLTYGHSVTAKLMVTAMPACSNATPTWGAVARPDGLLGLLTKLLGLPGLPLDKAHSSLGTAVDDSCHLAFAAQPQDTAVATHITGTGGGAVTVDVLDQNNAIVTNSNAPVSMAIGNNTGGGALSGTTPQNAVHGVASFPDLEISKQGVGYTLLASNATMVPSSTTSSPFNIDGVGTSCTAAGGTCSLMDTGMNGEATIAATPQPGAPPSNLLESVNPPGGPALSCDTPADYVFDPDTYQVSMSSSDYSKQVTIDITNPVGAPAFTPGDDDTGTGNDGDNDYDDVPFIANICFSAPYPFTDSAGVTPTPVGGFYTGLLPDCPTGEDPVITNPCNERSMDSVQPGESSYGITVVAEIPYGEPGDPFMN